MYSLARRADNRGLESNNMSNKIADIFHGLETVLSCFDLENIGVSDDFVNLYLSRWNGHTEENESVALAFTWEELADSSLTPEKVRSQWNQAFKEERERVEKEARERAERQAAKAFKAEEEKRAARLAKQAALDKWRQEHPKAAKALDQIN